MAAELHIPTRKTVIPPQHYPAWKPHKGKHQIEYQEDTVGRRKKRNDRRKTLFQKSLELGVISGGHVFTLYTDDNGQTWIYTNSEQLWNTYRSTGLKQGPLEKRCGDDMKVIDISDASLEETKYDAVAAAAVPLPPPPEPTEDCERILDAVEIKTEPMISPDEMAYIVDEISKDRPTEALAEINPSPESQTSYVLYPTVMKKNDFWLQKPDEQHQPEASIGNRPDRVANESQRSQSASEEFSTPQAAEKRQGVPLSSYRIESFSNHPPYQASTQRNESWYQRPAEQPQTESLMPNSIAEQPPHVYSQSEELSNPSSIQNRQHKPLREYRIEGLSNVPYSAMLKQEESQEQPKPEYVQEDNVATETQSVPSVPKKTPQAGQKRPRESLGKYRIEGSSCTACAQGFPDKKQLRLHLSCHKRTKPT